MSVAFRWTGLWIAGSALMVIAALSMVTASFDGHQYLPSNADAFYHARRILDSVFSGEPVIQFDDRIHVPEGSWLTWPWGFDTVLAWITRGLGPYAAVPAANRVLMNIPPAAAPIAIALVVNIARQLKLPLLFATLLVLGFAALPTAQAPFSVGNVDHHFAELLWTLGALSAGIWFFSATTSSPAAGITLGCVLGSALAMHNSLFVLMVPIALTLALTWLRGALPAKNSMLGFAVALVAMAALVCVPSQPWRRGFFEFFTLSWFHLYLTACVAVFTMLLSWLPATQRNIFILVVAAVVAMIPLASAFGLAGEFISGDLESIRNITEAHSPYLLYSMYGEAMSVRLLSGLMWLSGPMLLLNLWWAFRERTAEMRFVAVAGALGLLLLQMQFRFAVFGEAAMLLTPLLLARNLMERLPQRRIEAMLGSALLFGFAFYPTLKNWQPLWTLGGDTAYSWLRPALPALESACEQRPGVVLADLDAGHWVRYHTGCSVIGDVFLLTPQHAAKAIESIKLLRLTPAELLARRPDIRYVFVHHSTGLYLGRDGKEGPDFEQTGAALPAMERELLARDARLPPQFKLRGEALTPGGQVYARVYEIDRAP